MLGYEHIRVIKKLILKSKKIILIRNKNYKKGISSSIKVWVLRKVTKKNKGFMITHSDMPLYKVISY